MFVACFGSVIALSQSAFDPAAPIVTAESIYDLGPEAVKQKSGYIEVNGTHGANMFYWLFESRSSPATDPFIIWLTGGPGCSGLFALFYENGPYQLSESGPLKLNPYSWNEHATIVFVDQPVGTGFSYVRNPADYVRDEVTLATELWNFIQVLFQENPQYAKLDFYIAGESYAGHYIPSFGSRIVAANLAKEGIPIPLKGVLMGNAWVDPRTQFPAYADYALSIGIISKPSHAAYRAAFGVCVKLIESGVWPVALEECQATVVSLIAHGKGFNMYDIRKKCDVPPLCYDGTPLVNYLSDEKVMEALGVTGHEWKECDMTVHTMLLGDWVKSFKTQVASLLESKIRVLVYNGDQDFVCNYIGGQDWVTNLDWSGKSAFEDADMSAWVVDGEDAGLVKIASGLTFLRVYQSGHMVPMDQPSRALSMLMTFVKGKDLGVKLPSLNLKGGFLVNGM